jgi:transcription elongation factor Elf1
MSGISCDNKWECYLCGHEANMKQAASGWLGNYQMLCQSCADDVYFNSKSKFHKAMTYYYVIGDIDSSKSNIQK